MSVREELREAVPGHTLAALDRYIDQKIPTGGFLRAVLENNLKEAMGRADSENRQSLFEIVSYLYNEAPATCWGSPEKVEAWLRPATPTQETKS